MNTLSVQTGPMMVDDESKRFIHPSIYFSDRLSVANVLLG